VQTKDRQTGERELVRCNVSQGRNVEDGAQQPPADIQCSLTKAAAQLLMTDGFARRPKKKMPKTEPDRQGSEAFKALATRPVQWKRVEFSMSINIRVN
jgi:hypothetical protein